MLRLFYIFGIILCIIYLSNASTNKNIFDRDLEICSLDPMTGFERTGKCETNFFDEGTHLVCARVNEDFLEYTKSKGNDLSTPIGSFPGLVPGNRWCLCVFRWYQAFRDGFAPPVVLDATNLEAIKYFKRFNVTIDDLRRLSQLN
jgi:uncharacterized protein (DUF2237 family)